MLLEINVCCLYGSQLIVVLSFNGFLGFQTEPIDQAALAVSCRRSIKLNIGATLYQVMAEPLCTKEARAPTSFREVRSSNAHNKDLEAVVGKR